MTKYMVASLDFYTVEFFDTYEEAIEECEKEVQCGEEARVYEISREWQVVIPEPKPQIMQLY